MRFVINLCILILLALVGENVRSQETPQPRISAQPWTGSELLETQHQKDASQAVLAKAVKFMGGDKYLNAKTQIGKGKYSIIREGAVISFQSFTDVIVYPDKERTEFRGGGVTTVQTNIGASGWVYDGELSAIRDQTERQIENFTKGLRTSLDNLLRGGWADEAVAEYAGKRPATLGKRNDVVKLSYDDGFVVEFEFAADTGEPQKASYKRAAADGTETVEEDRYAQFIDRGGIKTPYIIDRRSDGKRTSRINYESVDFNKTVPDSFFEKPASEKELKKQTL